MGNGESGEESPQPKVTVHRVTVPLSRTLGKSYCPLRDGRIFIVNHVAGGDIESFDVPLRRRGVQYSALRLAETPIGRSSHDSPRCSVLNLPKTDGISGSARELPLSFTFARSFRWLNSVFDPQIQKE